jgi:hypothetical protein
MNVALAPFERCRSGVAGFDEGVDRGAQLGGRAEADAS